MTDRAHLTMHGRRRAHDLATKSLTDTLMAQANAEMQVARNASSNSLDFYGKHADGVCRDVIPAWIKSKTGNRNKAVRRLSSECYLKQMRLQVLENRVHAHVDLLAHALGDLHHLFEHERLLARPHQPHARRQHVALYIIDLVISIVRTYAHVTHREPLVLVLVDGRTQHLFARFGEHPFDLLGVSRECHQQQRLQPFQERMLSCP